MRRLAVAFFVLGVCLRPNPLQADLSLRLEPVSGEPGEEVALEFWLRGLTDPVGVFYELIASRGGSEPACFDAADADDDGDGDVNLTDALVLLHFLFLGSGPLPAPGSESPWFDSTEDELVCE